MLEKIGLPARPSKRGSNWVVDASHCQGCSSQFTFFNRKHHCRRCGGLFCNGCTLQRMILRGQGDSPVRICDPCKQLEDAARFELRYGHKNRAAKGNLKQAPESEEEVLGQILATDRKQSMLAGRESQADATSGLRKTVSGTSSSSLKEGFTTQGREEIRGNISVELLNNTINDIDSRSPEDLRKQAVEEKNKYKILKGEGKPKEALQAYKHGKELERQADALEIALKKEKRMALNSSNSRNSAYAQNKDDNEESISKTLPSKRGNEKEVDLASELRDLGWSDADLHDADKKPAKLTLESELSHILGEVPRKGSGGIDKSQVIAHKKKALALKREGNLAEAREELKKAKILERQLEEQELLGGDDDDSDDELSALIRSMNEEKQDNLQIDYAPLPDFDFGLEVGNDFAVDGNFDVTDDDLNDPDLAAALKSFGWSDDEEENKSDHNAQVDPLDFEALQGQVLSLKKEALSQKRAGNVSEAMALLKKAKLLEKDMENMQSDDQTITPETMQKTSDPPVSSQSSVQRVTGDENAAGTNRLNANKPKNKLMIQRELLALKKKALALRREGRLEESEEELKKGKVLEQQLEEMENAPKVSAVKVGNKGDPEALDLGEVEADVTEQDMHDPALLSVLKNLGWSEDDNVESASMPTKTSKQMSQQSTHETIPSVVPKKVMRNKAEIQRELLRIKRKALLLRRQGNVGEAEQELEKAKALESEMAEMESANPVTTDSHGVGSLIHQERSDAILKSRVPEDEEVRTPEVRTPEVRTPEVRTPEVRTPEVRTPEVRTPEVRSPEVRTPEDEEVPTDSEGGNKINPPSSYIAAHGPSEFEPVSVQQFGYQSVRGSEHTVSVLPKSVKSVNIIDFPSVGDNAIVRSSFEDMVQKENSNVNSVFRAEVSNQPAIEVNAKVNPHHEDEILSHTTSTRFMNKLETVTSTRQPVIPEQNSGYRFDDQKAEILAHKIKAVALKREGRLVEAREELRKAKLLEKSLEDADQAVVDSEKASGSTQAIVSSENASASVQVTVGSRYASTSKQAVAGNDIEAASTSKRASIIDDGRTNHVLKPVSGRDRFKLQQESLSHKRNALKLRREGKTAEADAEFELAKVLESQLEEGQGSGDSASSAKVEANDGTVVEDLLDPQLMSALKSIGWGDADLATQPSKKSEPQPNAERSRSLQMEKTQLEEQIKAEKLRALNLKRAGKSDQALDALRSAKRLEKKLGLLAS